MPAVESTERSARKEASGVGGRPAAATALQRSSVSDSCASWEGLRASLDHASVHTRCRGAQALESAAADAGCGHGPAECAFKLRMALDAGIARWLCRV